MFNYTVRKMKPWWADRNSLERATQFKLTALGISTSYSRNFETYRPMNTLTVLYMHSLLIDLVMSCCLITVTIWTCPVYTAHLNSPGFLMECLTDVSAL